MSSLIARFETDPVARARVIQWLSVVMAVASAATGIVVAVMQLL